MTNIFAMRIEYDKKPIIFCVTDSQATNPDAGKKTKGAQKLVQRGHNLVMGTGPSDIIRWVEHDLAGKDGNGQETCERVLDMTEKWARHMKGNDDSRCSFIVAGREKDGVAIHKVALLDATNSKRGWSAGYPYLCLGSGAGEVEPALGRDSEMGFLAYPTCPADALFLCYIVGMKAETSIGVDHRLQFGFVAPDAIRMLVAPGTHPESLAGINTYCEGLTGIKLGLTDKKDSDGGKLDLLRHTTNAFYRTLETEMEELFTADVNCNSYHSYLKQGKVTMQEYTDALAARQKQRAVIEPICDAFMRGGLERILHVVRDKSTRDAAVYQQAEKLLPPTP